MDLITEYLNIIKQQGELIEAKNAEIKLLKNKSKLLQDQIELYKRNVKAWKDRSEALEIGQVITYKRWSLDA